MKRKLVYALLMVGILGTLTGCGKTESQLSELNNTKTAEQLQQEDSTPSESTTPSEGTTQSEEPTSEESTGESNEGTEEDSNGTPEESEGTSEDGKEVADASEDDEDVMDLDTLSEFDNMDSGNTDGKDSTELAARRAVENGIECGLPELKLILPKYLVDHVSTTTILDAVKNPKPYHGTFVSYGTKKCSPIKLVAVMKYSDVALKQAGYIGTSVSVYDNYSTVSVPTEKANIGMQKVDFMETVGFEKPSLMTSAGKTWMNKAYPKKWKKSMKGTLYSMTKSDTTYDVLFLYAKRNEEDAKAQMELIMDSVYFVD